MPGRWRFLNTGRSRGAFNMAVDQALLEQVGEGRSGPVLRVFGWEPPAVSLGYGQDPGRELDLERCRALGVEVVRRPTGGRAVLHWDELTYSVVFPEGDPHLGGRISDTYCAIGQCLVEGLRVFGVEAALERASTRPAGPRPAAARAPCFSSAARWEVVLQGRKLVGSAQRRGEGATLQHGSLLLGPEHERLLELVRLGGGAERAAAAQQLHRSSTCLRAGTDRVVDFDQLAGCLAEGFGRCLQVEMQADQLTRAERARAAELLAEGYAGLAWKGLAANPGRPAAEVLARG